MPPPPDQVHDAPTSAQVPAAQHVPTVPTTRPRRRTGTSNKGSHRRRNLEPLKKYSAEEAPGGNSAESNGGNFGGSGEAYPHRHTPCHIGAQRARISGGAPPKRGASIRSSDTGGIVEGRNALMEAVDILDQIFLNYDSEKNDFTMDPAALQDELLRLAQQLQIVVPAHNNLLGDIPFGVNCRLSARLQAPKSYRRVTATSCSCNSQKGGKGDDLDPSQGRGNTGSANYASS
ncbi:unnamed protein product [Symbiodinium microadriaticum]|nr:unnamed protein product [Symbiodinium microadriaticum]